MYLYVADKKKIKKREKSLLNVVTFGAYIAKMQTWLHWIIMALKVNIFDYIWGHKCNNNHLVIDS